MPPTVSDLNIWADEYLETFPVVSDVQLYIHTFGKKGGQVALPSTTLLGRGMEILIADGDVTEEDIIAALQ